MRRRRRIDAMLMTTALVLVAAVFVALAVRLITDSDYTEQVAVFVPADDLTLPRTTDVDDDEPQEDDHEANVDMPGVIDRHHLDLEHMQPSTTETESSTEDIEIEAYRSDNEADAPMSQPPTTEPTTTVKTTTTRDPNAFKDVDIRYYANSEAGLNLREEPSTKSKVIKQLDYGTPLRVIALNDEWAKVRLSGLVIGYVSRDFITKYRPVTETSPPPTTTTTTTTSKKTTTTTTAEKTTATSTVEKTTATTAEMTSATEAATERATEETSATTTTTTTTKGTTLKPPEGGIKFVNPGNNSAAHANLKILKQYGLINKEGSSSINRHYETFTDNGDGTITVDGITFTYSQEMPGRCATHYDGVAVCRYRINRDGKCWLGHTTPTCHGTASGLLAQRGIVAVTKSDASIYPRGTVVFVRGYGMAVVGDRSGGSFDLCYDADECKLLTRRNWTNGIYIITP